MWAFAVVAAVTLAVGGYRWLTEPQHSNADVFYYSRAALEFTGQSASDSGARAGEFSFQVLHPGGSGSYTASQLVVSDDPRYAAIFAARPLYPALAAPLIPAFGLWSLVVVSFACAVVAALAVAAGALTITSSPAIAAIAAVAFIVSPGGRYAFWPTADPPMLALVAVALAAAGAYLTRGSRLALGTVLIALMALIVTKIGNLDVLAITLMATGAAGVLLRAEWRRRAVVLAGVGAFGLACAIAVGALLGWPTVTDQIQDMVTQHFHAPDVPDPWVQLAKRDVLMWQWIGRDAFVAVEALAVACSVIGLIARRTSPGVWPWLIAIPATGLLVLIHPVHSEIDRILAPLWLSVAVGVAVLVGEVSKWLARRQAPQGPQPA